MNAISMEAASTIWTEPRFRILIGQFELLRRFGAKLGPYVLLELLLPGGTLFTLLGFTGIAAFQTLAYVALTTTTALNTILLLALAPLAIVAISWLALGERVTRVQAFGLGISLVGAAVLILHGDPATLAECVSTPATSMLLAVVLWAVYWVLLRRRPAEVPPLALHTMSVAAGTLSMLPHSAGKRCAAARFRAAWRLDGSWIYRRVFFALATGLWVRGVATIGPIAPACSFA